MRTDRLFAKKRARIARLLADIEVEVFLANRIVSAVADDLGERRVHALTQGVVILAEGKARAERAVLKELLADEGAAFLALRQPVCAGDLGFDQKIEAAGYEVAA